MKEPKKRPGALWMFFYGRPRRGFPWLLAGVVTLVVLLALTFAVPGAADVWRTLAPIFVVVLITGAIAAAALAVRRPRRPR